MTPAIFMTLGGVICPHLRMAETSETAATSLIIKTMLWRTLPPLRWGWQRQMNGIYPNPAALSPRMTGRSTASDREMRHERKVRISPMRCG